MESVVLRFPVLGRYQEDARMGYYIEDEEHDALELCPIEAFALYNNLRRRMDFATGIVGGPKRRISWAEITGWMHRDSARGRKAVNTSVSKARRLVEQMVKVELLEYRTDREEDRLMFFLPLARSDVSEARKRRDPQHQRQIQESIAQAGNCVMLTAVREATTGAFIPNHLEEPEPSAHSLETVQNYSIREHETACESRQTFDSPQSSKADSVSCSVSAESFETCSAQDAETRQDFDRVPESKADNNNPFTPLPTENIQSTHIPTRERAREVAGHATVTQAVRAALRTDPQPSSVIPLLETEPAPKARRVQHALLPDLETLAYDDRSGFSLQISDGLRRKNPDLVRKLQQILSEEMGGAR